MLDMKEHIARFKATLRGGTYFRAEAAADDTGEVYIYDSIGAGWFGGISAKDVVDALAPLKDVKTLNVYLNSPGGDVFDGIAIYNVLQRHAGRKVVTVDGLAASAASLIAMAGDEIKMGSNAMMMIHQPWGFAIGNAVDMRKTADELDQISGTLVNTYVTRTKNSAEQVKTWLDAETWMDANQAKERGFCNTVLEATSETAADEPKNEVHPLVTKFSKTPPVLRKAARASATAVIRSMKRRIDAAQNDPKSNAHKEK